MVRELRRYTKRNLKRNQLIGLIENLSITNWIIITNVLFFLIASILLIYNATFLKYIALQPSLILEGKYFWTIITSMFMHANFFHLAVNMFVLFSLGNFCEKIIGRKRFLWFYLLSGIFAGILFVLLSGYFGTGIGERIFGSPNIPGVGASGAIFAIAGLFVILTPRLRFAIIFLPFFSLPAYIMIPLVLFATWVISAGANWAIGNTAHFGGFLAGVFYGIYLKLKFPNKVRKISQLIQ
jgi:membrane associated rhomboid family serine protease